MLDELERKGERRCSRVDRAVKRREGVSRAPRIDFDRDLPG